jgi:hypothetical protein
VSVTDEVFANFRRHDESKTVSSNSKFFRDHANLLHSLCSQKGLAAYAAFLAREFGIYPGYKFVFPDISRLSSRDAKRMVDYFLLHTASLIFNRRDFEYAKKVMAEIELDIGELEPLEVQWLERVKVKTRFKYWSLFRLNRKWNAIFNKNN